MSAMRRHGETMDIQREFGRRVRELRKRAGLTQQALADKCGEGFVMQRIGEIERGEANCTLQTVERLARGLRCDPAELFLFSPQKVGKSLALLDERLLDLWKKADENGRRKIVRVVGELF